MFINTVSLNLQKLSFGSNTDTFLCDIPCQLHDDPINIITALEEYHFTLSTSLSIYMHVYIYLYIKFSCM